MVECQKPQQKQRQGIFKSEDPAKRARAIVKAVTHFNDPQVGSGFRVQFRFQFECSDRHADTEVSLDSATCAAFGHVYLSRDCSW